MLGPLPRWLTECAYPYLGTTRADLAQEMRDAYKGQFVIGLDLDSTDPESQRLRCSEISAACGGFLEKDDAQADPMTLSGKADTAGL